MSVELQGLWTLHGTQGGPNAFYAHGHPEGAGALTRAIAQRLNLPDAPLTTVPSRVRLAAEVLWREVATRAIPANPIDVDGIQVQITGPEHITHFATEHWGGEPVNAQVVTWNREPRTVDGRDIQVRQEIMLQIADLTPAARESIHRLNGHAMEMLAQSYASALQELAGGTPVELQPRKVSVFLSYRSTNRAVAQRLHDAIEAYGNGTHFDVYLDLHDRKLGDLREQLAKEIDGRSVFAIACTADYAEPQTVSEFEFVHAEERRKRGLLQFAPVVLAEPRPEIWKILEPLVRVRVGPDNDFADEVFLDMLRTILGSVPT